MNKGVRFNQVGFELLQVQLVWTLWYLGIVLLIDLVRFFIFGQELDSLYDQSFVSSNIFMLVIGIIAINFLPYYVENGVTRKNYFFGNVIASICLSILIPVFSYVLTIFQRALFHVGESNLSHVPDVDPHPIADLFQSILLTPYINFDTNLFLSLAIFSLNIFGFYLLGWFIGAAFYRLGVVLGIVGILFGILLSVIRDTMLRIALDLPIFESFSMFAVTSVTFAGTVVFLITVLFLVLIYLLIKRAPIKI